MDARKIIAEIEWLEHLLELCDNRTLAVANEEVKKQKDNETYFIDPWPLLPRQEWLEQLAKLQDNRPLEA
jgi:hypothetical protein